MDIRTGLPVPAQEKRNIPVGGTQGEIPVELRQCRAQILQLQHFLECTIRIQDSLRAADESHGLAFLHDSLHGPRREAADGKRHRPSGTQHLVAVGIERCVQPHIPVTGVDYLECSSDFNALVLYLADIFQIACLLPG